MDRRAFLQSLAGLDDGRTSGMTERTVPLSAWVARMMFRKRVWRFGFVAVLSLAGGCTGDGGLTNDPSAGELGRAEFSWEETGFF